MIIYKLINICSYKILYYIILIVAGAASGISPKQIWWSSNAYNFVVSMEGQTSNQICQFDSSVTISF